MIAIIDINRKQILTNLRIIYIIDTHSLPNKKRNRSQVNHGVASHDVGVTAAAFLLM